MPRDDDDRPRRRRPQEEDDYRDGPPRKGNPAVWIILAIVGVLGVVGLTLVIVTILWFRPVPAGGGPPPAPVVVTPGPPGAMKLVRDREDMKTLLVGKTMEEVKALLGMPESTRQVAGQDVWRYERVSRDRVTGKTDTKATIYFTEGKVTDILF